MPMLLMQVTSMADFAELQAEHRALQALTHQPGFPHALYFGQQDVPSGLTPIGKGVTPGVDSITPGGKGIIPGGGAAASSCYSGWSSGPKPSPSSDGSRSGAEGARQPPPTTSGSYSSVSEPRAVLVMEVLGPSLEKLLYETTLGTGGLSPMTVIALADQVRGLQSMPYTCTPLCRARGASPRRPPSCSPIRSTPCTPMHPRHSMQPLSTIAHTCPPIRCWRGSSLCLTAAWYTAMCSRPTS